MSVTNPYCTVADVQAEIRNDDTDLTSTLERAIGVASRWIDRKMGRDYYQHDFTTTPIELSVLDRCIYEGMLFLPYRPIISISRVVVNGTDWTEGTHYMEVTNRKTGEVNCLAVIQPPEDARLTARVASWPIGYPPDYVTQIYGKFGYAQASATVVPTGIPAYITQAAILVAAALSGHNMKDVIGLDGAKTTVIDKDIPRVVYDLLGHKSPLPGT